MLTNDVLCIFALSLEHFEILTIFSFKDSAFLCTTCHFPDYGSLFNMAFLIGNNQTFVSINNLTNILISKACQEKSDLA